MIHNGIEYGLMQAYAEGFDILRNAKQRSPAGGRTLRSRCRRHRRGLAPRQRRSTSWLLDLTASALAKDPELADFTGGVEDSGEGRWTVEAAIEEAVPANVLSAALYARFRSRREQTFAEKILSAMRKGFGGHVEPKAAPKSGPKPDAKAKAS